MDKTKWRMSVCPEAKISPWAVSAPQPPGNALLFFLQDDGWLEYELGKTCDLLLCSCAEGYVGGGMRRSEVIVTLSSFSPLELGRRGSIYLSQN
jgi:hypothetical protein